MLGTMAVGIVWNKVQHEILNQLFLGTNCKKIELLFYLLFLKWHDMGLCFGVWKVKNLALFSYEKHIVEGLLP